MSENHRPPTHPKPQVYKPLKKRHATTSANLAVAAATGRRQSTLLDYSADPRQRHDASVELVPGLALPPPPPQSSRSARRSAGSGKADVGQRKLTEFGVCGKEEKVGSRDEEPAASHTVEVGVESDRDAVRQHGHEWTGFVDESRVRVVDEWEPKDMASGAGIGECSGAVGDGVEQDRAESDLKSTSPPSRSVPARDAVDPRPIPAINHTHHRPVSPIAPQRPPHPQRAPPLLLADLPAAPQYFEVLPRLPYYPPTPPRTDVSEFPTTAEPEQAVHYQPPDTDPDPIQKQVAKVRLSAQQRIDQARAQRRPVTLAMIVDLWREQLAFEMNGDGERPDVGGLSGESSSRT